MDHKKLTKMENKQPTHIKDYLHLYLGCEVVVKPTKEHHNWVGNNPTILNGYILSLLEHDTFVFKPILRPLSDMTEEESRHDFPHRPTSTERAAEVTKWLLSKHFDLFGLIAAGLAIDKTTLQTNEK